MPRGLGDGVWVIYTEPLGPASCKMTPKNSRDDQRIALRCDAFFFFLAIVARHSDIARRRIRAVAQAPRGRKRMSCRRIRCGARAPQAKLAGHLFAVVEEEEAEAARPDRQNCRQGRYGSSGTGVIVYAQIFCLVVDPL